MARGWRPCPKPHCPVPTPPSQRYCDEHLAEYEAKRGNYYKRSGGKVFAQTRKQWEPKVQTGAIHCWRCLELIPANDDWHLGHHDDDRNIIMGPEHGACNLSAAGKSSHRHD